MALGSSAPVRIVFDQLDIKTVKPACRTDVKGALADLFDGGDASKGQEEAEMVREVRISAGDRFTGVDVLGLKIDTVRSKDKLCFRRVVAALS